MGPGLTKPQPGGPPPRALNRGGDSRVLLVMKVGVSGLFVSGRKRAFLERASQPKPTLTTPSLKGPKREANPEVITYPGCP